MYKKVFSNSEILTLVSEQTNSRSNYWLQTVILKPQFKYLAKMILKKCHENKIYIRPAWRPLHQLGYFKKIS